MPHSFPLNSYVVSKDGKHYRKILAELGYLRYVSWCWNKGGYADKDSYGLMQCDQANKFMTLAEMNAYYNPCSVKEATGKVLIMKKTKSPRNRRRLDKDVRNMSDKELIHYLKEQNLPSLAKVLRNITR